MARHYDWSPAGYSADPIPGDPQVLRDEATKFKSVAESITEAATNLRNIANTGDASGEFVEEFATQANEVADRISKAEIKYTGLADALREYAGPLEQFQQDSVDILNRAINANANAQDGAKWEQHWTRELLEPDLTPEQVEDIQKKLDGATRDRMDGESGAIFARRELEALGIERDNAASTAANKIKQAGEDSGINDSGWDNWVQWWEEHDELIDNIMFYVGVVGGALAVIAMFVPGLNVIVGAIIAVITVVTLLNALAQVTAGTKSRGEALLDCVLALVPLGLGKLAKSAVKVATNSAATTVRTSKAAQGISGWTQSRALAFVESELAPVVTTRAQRLLSSEALALAKLEAIQNMALTASGTAGAAEAIAKSQLWKVTNVAVAYEPIAALVPNLVIEPALEAATGNAADWLNFENKQEMSW